VCVCVCRKNSQRTIDELRANVSDLETRLRNETNRLKTRYETEHHEMEMQIDVLGRNNAELNKNNKGLLAKLKVCTSNTRRSARQIGYLVQQMSCTIVVIVPGTSYSRPYTVKKRPHSHEFSTF